MIYSIMVFYDFIKINHDQAALIAAWFIFCPLLHVWNPRFLYLSQIPGTGLCRGCGERFFLYLQHLRMELAAGKLSG